MPIKFHRGTLMQTILKGNGKVKQGKCPLSPGLGKPTEKAETVPGRPAES